MYASDGGHDFLNSNPETFALNSMATSVINNRHRIVPITTIVTR